MGVALEPIPFATPSGLPWLAYLPFLSHLPVPAVPLPSRQSFVRNLTIPSNLPVDARYNLSTLRAALCVVAPVAWGMGSKVTHFEEFEQCGSS